MSCRNFDSGPLFNRTLEECVRIDVLSGSTSGGAIQRLAEFLGISPSIVRYRIEGKYTGAPRNPTLLARCHEYFDEVMNRRHAQTHRLAREIHALRQLALPLESETNEPDPERERLVAKHLWAAEGALASARRGASDYQRARAKKLIT